MKKIILDIVMIGLFVPLMFVNKTGLVFHEIAGLSIMLLFMLHLILNRSWIVNTTKKLISNKLKSKTLFMYYLNVALLIGVIVIAVTGLLISTVIIGVAEYNPTLVTLHKWSAYITAGLLCVHLMLHIKYLYVMFKRYKKTVGSVTVVIIAVVAVFFTNVIDFAQPFAENVARVEVVSVSPETAQQTQPEISLSEFLEEKICNRCSRKCPLSKPRCGKASSLIEQAKEEYYEIYGGE
jgi:hypothetical protein